MRGSGSSFSSQKKTNKEINSNQTVAFYNLKGLTSLPTLPDTLHELYCFNNQIVSLPDLPRNLRILDCHNNELTSLPVLPLNLRILDCHNNELTFIPNSGSLVFLDCHNNQLEELPRALIRGVKNLDCSNNKLKSLQDLPLNMSELNCSSNELTSIILHQINSSNMSPNQLYLDFLKLNCNNNKLVSLPDAQALPPNLTDLNCSNNQLTELPFFLPANLKIFNCSYNKLTSLIITFPLCRSVERLECSNNRLTTLEMRFQDSHNTTNKIKYLDCSNNPLTTLGTLPPELSDLVLSIDQIDLLNPDLHPDLVITRRLRIKIIDIDYTFQNMDSDTFIEFYNKWKNKMNEMKRNKFSFYLAYTFDMPKAKERYQEIVNFRKATNTKMDNLKENPKIASQDLLKKIGSYLGGVTRKKRRKSRKRPKKHSKMRYRTKL